MTLGADVAAQTSVDYDSNNNNLIDVRTSTQLEAITHDLTGVGSSVNTDYQAAFPNAMSGMGCPGTCRGYELLNDVTLSGDWDPIGYRPVVGALEPPADIRYEATFEGNGHVIRGLRLARGITEEDLFLGLFSALGADGIIRNVGLVNVAVFANTADEGFVGALAGHNFGRVVASYVVGGRVTGGYQVGGLVGENRGKIVASYANVRVTGGEDDFGGLVGRVGSGGDVIASYALGLVERDDLNILLSYGGLVGRVANGRITNSYFVPARSGANTNGIGVPSSARKMDLDLHAPTSATGIYAAWDDLNVDNTSSTVMGVLTLNDDAPWDFGNSLQYPVLRYARTEAVVQAQFASQPMLPALMPTFVGDATVSEGTTAIYVVSLAIPLPAGVTASWSWSVGGAAVDADDFDGTTRGRVVIAPGESSASFSLAVAADGVAEFAEVFEVSLGDAQLEGAANVRLGVPAAAVQTTIEVNRVTLAASSATVTEGATATFTVRSGGSGDEAVVVEYEMAAVGGLTAADLHGVTVADRAGTSGVQVVALPITGSVTLDMNGTARISVRTTDDDVALEGGEGFRLRLTRCLNCRENFVVVEIGVPSSLTIVINDDDLMDYSSDDRLIDVRTVEQLHAIRWDLNGDGRPDAQAYATSYSAAFPRPALNMGCATTCTGYALWNDVDLSSVQEGAGWPPIGGGIDQGGDYAPPNTIYKAVFDGNGYVIKNMKIELPSGSYNRIGLFSALGASGVIRSVGLVNVTVNASGNSVNTGGLVGVSSGVIAASYVAEGSVQGTWVAGGLVGRMFDGGTVIASYANVSVNALSASGGLVGSMNGASIVSASYAIGRVDAQLSNGNVGGLAGERNSNAPEIRASYFDRQRSGQSSCCGGTPLSSDNQTSKMSAQLRDPTSPTGIYTGWGGLDVDGDGDFDDAPWDFGASFQYPVLRHARTDAAVQAQYSSQPEVTLTPTLVGDEAVSEGATASYVVSLDATLSSVMTASWSWSVAGDAVDAGDFDGSTRGRVIIAPGESSASLSLAVTADGAAEFAESFEVSLGDALFEGAANVRLGVPAAVRTTIAAHGVRRVTLASSSATVAEGMTATFTVRLGASGGEAVVVEYELAAVGGLTPADLDRVSVTDRAGTNDTSVVALPVTGSVTLDADGVATMSVRTTDDDVPVEGGEGFRLRLTRCPNCREHVAVLSVPSSLTVAINDDDVMDYSGDGRLIDVRTAEQLHAMRWDLDGDGVADEQAYATSYSAAFPAPAPNMGCDTACAGYALFGDVDLGASRFGRGGDGAGWPPIGAASGGYGGDFDGRDYVISGLYIHRPSSDYVGLFARIGTGGTTQRSVRNLGLIDVDVTGGDRVGTLAGWVSTGVAVSKVYAASGSVAGNEGVGGLAGMIGADVIAAYASVSVSGTSAVGGLAGVSDGAADRRLVASYAAGRVAGTSDVGGLVGRDADGMGTAEDSYWDTFFSGLETSALGVGTDTGTLQRPTTYGGIYAAWNVDVGGDGAADDPWRFGTSFDYPVLSGDGAHVARQFALQSQFQIALRVAGIATVAEGGAVTYTVAASRALPYPVAVSWEVGAGVGAVVATADDFRADAMATLPLAAYPTGTATIRQGATETTFSVYVLADEVPEEAEPFRVVVRAGDFGGRVIVASESSAVATTIEFKGRNYDGDGDGLIDVATRAQLSAIRYDLNGRGVEGVGDEHSRTQYLAAFGFFDAARTCPRTCTGYELLNDIDLSGEDWNPIGGGGRTSASGNMLPEQHRYNAVFEGNGHVISNMRVYAPYTFWHFVGLFRAVSGDGVIRNVGLTNVIVDVDRASIQAGALAGAVYGDTARVAASYATGSVKTGWGAGGLVGHNDKGTMIACYANVSVEAKHHNGAVGGLVGALSGSGVVSASYSIGRVTGVNSVGGLTGSRGGEITGSYFDLGLSQQSSCCGAGTSPVPDTAPRTSAALSTPTAAVDIYAGWDQLDVDGDGDFDDAPWDFGASFQYPVLRHTDAAVQAQHSSQPEVTLTPTLVGDETVSEGAAASYVVNLGEELSSVMTASWSWSVDGGEADASDFDGSTRGRVVIAPGGSSASFSLAVAADGVAEFAEGFEVSLGDALFEGVANVRLGVPAVAARTTIAANLRQVTVAAAATVTEGTTATFTVRLGDSGGEAVVVEYELAAVGGLTPADLHSVTVADRAGTTGASVVALPVTGSVTLDADGTARVLVRTTDNDAPADGDEGFRLRLTRCPNCRAHVAEIGVPSSDVVLILDDDFVDYSGDGRLIDVRTAEQLHAMRWDLDGDGVVDEQAYATSYSAAFPRPAPNMGCDTACDGYALAGDVDLGASRFGRSGGGAGWPPIGDGSGGYGGDFDGRDHVISGLYIRRPSSDHVGLFARLGAGGAGGTTQRSVRNLGLIDVDVTGGDRVGTLAGWVSTGVAVSKVYASSGSVAGNEGVGGLAGVIGADVIAAYASVSVSGTSAVGGLAGVSDGAADRRLAASYAAGRVAGTSDVGGLVGRDADGMGTAEDSYWDTFFSGLETSALGVGTDTGSLQEPTTYGGIYAAWDVDVGGDGAGDDPWRFGTSFDYPVLSGDEAHVARQFSLQSQFQITLGVTGVATVAEGQATTYTVVASRALPYPVAVAWEVGAGAGAVVAAADDFRADAMATLPLAAYPTGTATIRQGATQTTFRVYVLADEVPEEAEPFRVFVRVGDFGGRVIVASESSAAATTIEFKGRNYNADGDDLIDVATTAQLAAIRHDLNGRGIEGVSDQNEADYKAAFPFFDKAQTCPGTCAGYELLNDVDLSSVSNWTPIGGGYSQESPAWSETGGGSAGFNQPLESIRYNATFEGNGYVVRNMRIQRGSGSLRYDYVGLFGFLGVDGVIRSVGVENAYVYAPVSGRVGPLVGLSYGRIVASYAVSEAGDATTMTGAFAVGGLVGEMNDGIVIASYSDVAVHSEGRRVGGLIGSELGSSIVSASYTIGKPIAALDHIGGLVGYRSSLEIQASYYDKERSGQSSCCGNNPPSPDEVGKTSAALSTPTAAVGIYAGWDRLNVNGVDENGDEDVNDDAPWDFGASFQYPVLRHGRTEAAVQAQHLSQPEVTLTPTLDGSETVSEGATASYVVSLDATLSSVMTASWSWSVAGGEVDAGDFDGSTRGRVVIAPGESSASFSLAVAADGVAEFAESFEVSLGDALFEGVANARLGVPASAVQTTIAAHLSQVTVAASSATVAEGATATFTLRLNGGGAAPVVVEFEVAAVSGAVTPADLESVTVIERSGTNSMQVTELPTTGTVTLGIADIATVSVVVAADDVPGEGDERFRLQLTGCRDCGSVHPIEIGVPAAAEVDIRGGGSVVSAHVYLQGAYAGGGRMKTRLIEYLPARSPYAVAPWNAQQITVPGMSAGDFGLSGVTDTVVDWVLVELRKTPRDAGATSAVTSLARQSSLLLSDGTIVGVDGLNGDVLRTEGVLFAGVRIDDASEDMYVLIHHRNHLSVMAAATVAGCAAAGGNYCADFRLQPSHQNCQASLIAGRYAMFAGDIDGDNDIDADDEAVIRANNLETMGRRHYQAAADGRYAIGADLDFDGEVLSADRRYIILNTSENALAPACPSVSRTGATPALLPTPR